MDAAAACSVVGEYHHELVLGRRSDDRGAVFRLNGERISDVLPVPVEGGAAAINPSLGIVVLTQFRKRKVTAIDWNSGRPLWAREGVRDPWNLVCSEDNRLSVLQAGGMWTSLNARDGSHIGSVSQVRSVWGDGRLSHVIMMRGRFAPDSLRVEWWEDATSGPKWSRSTDLSFSLGAVSRDWVVLADHPTGSLVCFDSSGEERWRYVPAPCIHPVAASPGRLQSPFHFWTIMKSADERSVIAIQRLKDVEWGPTANQLVELHAETGAVIRSTPIPQYHLAPVPVAKGQYFASAAGLLASRDASWIPRAFLVPSS